MEMGKGGMFAIICLHLLSLCSQYFLLHFREHTKALFSEATEADILLKGVIKVTCVYNHLP